MNVLGEVVAKIEAISPTDPDRTLKIQAIVKRHVHEEKAGLLHRMRYYCDFGRHRRAKGRRARNKVTLSGLRFMKDFIESKLESHSKFACMPDEEVITWSVGRHVYKNGKLVLKDEECQSTT